MTQTRRTAAFTLIELLAASALAAVLMLVLFQVIGSLGRSRAALARVEQSDASARTAWKADLLDLFRWDLSNATEASFKPGVVTLTGHGALDRRSLAVDQQPVTVVYRLEPRGRSACLVRHQFPRGGVTNDASWSELVCANVTAFEMSPTSREDQRSTSTRVRIDGTRGPIVDEVIVVK
jgi:type II secretory pathway pseudopilin PulG